MEISRWRLLSNDDSQSLTDEEIEAGWHFCIDWDGLLIGPSMSEWEFCSCKDESDDTN